ncbi:type II toxin-antitoxin system VapC family toxin [Candidatus Poribacteria bacterium]|nr:type II toxin-antitoxin system VapC family toxin [Candidatus Poribacteria bacterium]
MIHYAEVKPAVYLESTVVSYLISRPSNDAVISSRQQATQQLWNEYSDDFEFVASFIVANEIQRGDAEEAQRRLRTLENLRKLEFSLEARLLSQLLIDAGAIPSNSTQDAQHIAIAATNNLDYLVSWDFKHIVNRSRFQNINNICRDAGFNTVTILTPEELIEGIRMKEESIPPTDPILEEIYRMKEEFNAQFNSLEELFAYLKDEETKAKARGVKFVPAPPPPPGAMEKMEKMLKELNKDSE